jgi:hypothetical protein
MCNQPLHVKDFQAGKRGKCPKCQGSFRVPAKDADFSLAVEESAAIPVTAKSKASTKPKADPLKPVSPKTSKAIKPSTVSAKVRPAEKQPVDPKPAAIASVSEPLTMPASLLPLLDARWFVRPPSGGQFGPATTQMLLDWIAEKRVTADSLLWRDGLETWFPANELVPEPFGGSPPIVTKPAPEMPKSTEPAVFAPAMPNTTASNKAALVIKKKKQLKKQWLVLGLLATIALCLFVALMLILTRGT